MLSFHRVHPSFKPMLAECIKTITPDYITSLKNNRDWLPGEKNIFNAFSIPFDRIKYILLGESPYPRAASAIGYAFWDGAVDTIWSEKGLSKAVNRATSLRNFIKMLLLVNQDLTKDNLTQAAIAETDKTYKVKTLSQLFENMLAEGFLLLNASLVLSQMPVKQEAKIWYPFVARLLENLALRHQPTKLLLFGKVASQFSSLGQRLNYEIISAQHPYNLAFIHDKQVQRLFKPLDLLSISQI